MSPSNIKKPLLKDKILEVEKKVDATHAVFKDLQRVNIFNKKTVQVVPKSPMNKSRNINYLIIEESTK